MTRAIIVVGLGFGDEGKGSIVDYLVRSRQAQLVVRYNGGSQASHAVVTPSGQTHTFAQFGSGTLVPGVRTHLSQYMKIDPLNMLSEDRALHALGITDAFARTTVDGRALVITPFQKIANRLRERARGADRHGSCGLGVGETQADAQAGYAITIADLDVPHRLTHLLRTLQQYKWAQLQEFGVVPPLSRLTPLSRDILDFFVSPIAIDRLIEWYTDFTRVGITIRSDLDRLSRAWDLQQTVIFEGAQGVLLDQDYGFHPYTTWSRTTSANADDMLNQAGWPPSEITRLGVLRTYLTRHGPGPFVTEDRSLAALLPDTHNGFNEWQHEFRLGWPDLVLARYAAELTNADSLAITHLDRWRHLQDIGLRRRVAFTHRIPTATVVHFPRLIPRSIEEQCALTQQFFSSTPQYIDNPNDLCRMFEDELDIPVRLTSYGPTASDKIEHKTLTYRRI